MSENAADFPAAGEGLPGDMTQSPAGPGAIAHPLVDAAGPGWVATETGPGLVWASGARTDLLARAVRERSRVVMVSPVESRLTESMRDLLTSLGGLWVVRDHTGRLTETRTGRLIDDLEAALHPPDAAAVADWFVPSGPPQAVQLIVSWSIRHRAEAATVIGPSLDTFLAKLGLGPVTGWGVHEPVTEPWDPVAMTKYARERMPESTRITITGSGDHPVALTLLVQRTDHGVEELVTGIVGAGHWSDPAADARLEAVSAALAALCEAAMPLFGLVLARGGRADLATPPSLPHPAAPVAMLIGAPGVRQLEIDVPDLCGRFDAIQAGRPRLPAIVFPLLPTPARGAGRLREVLEAIGEEKVRAIIDRPPPAGGGA